MGTNFKIHRVLSHENTPTILLFRRRRS